MESAGALGIQGLVCEVGGRVRGFTLGYPLDADSFCVLFEVADRDIKGLGQAMFQRFCASLEGQRYINCMDDSGLENLARVKASYRPSRLEPSYILTRGNG